MEEKILSESDLDELRRLSFESQARFVDIADEFKTLTRLQDEGELNSEEQSLVDVQRQTFKKFMAAEEEFEKALANFLKQAEEKQKNEQD